jgi:hypothetical protein
MKISKAKNRNAAENDVASKRNVIEMKAMKRRKYESQCRQISAMRERKPGLNIGEENGIWRRQLKRQSKLGEMASRAKS